MILMRNRCTLMFLVTRRSSWSKRLAKSVPGATSCNVAVLLGPAARGRPKDGAIWELGTTSVATIGGPAMLWNVPATWRFQGSGYVPLSLTSGSQNGGSMRQKALSGDGRPDRLGRPSPLYGKLTMLSGSVAAGVSTLPITLHIS